MLGQRVTSELRAKLGRLAQQDLQARREPRATRVLPEQPVM